MARNSLAGTKKGKSESAKTYQGSAKKRKVKDAYNKKYHKSKFRRAYRSLLNKINRKKKTYGNKDGKDVSHKKKGGYTLEKQSSNRARNRSKK